MRMYSRHALFYLVHCCISHWSGTRNKTQTILNGLRLSAGPRARDKEGGDRSSRPLDKGGWGAGLQKIFFGPFGPQFVLKIGGGRPPGPTPRSPRFNAMMSSFRTVQFEPKTPQNYNPRHISWDSYDVFCPLNVGFCDLISQKPEIQHWEGRNTTVCRNMVTVSGVPTQLDEDCRLQTNRRKQSKIKENT